MHVGKLNIYIPDGLLFNISSIFSLFCTNYHIKSSVTNYINMEKLFFIIRSVIIRPRNKESSLLICSLLIKFFCLFANVLLVLFSLLRQFKIKYILVVVRKSSYKFGVAPGCTLLMALCVILSTSYICKNLCF